MWYCKELRTGARTCCAWLTHALPVTPWNSAGGTLYWPKCNVGLEPEGPGRRGSRDRCCHNWRVPLPLTWTWRKSPSEDRDVSPNSVPWVAVEPLTVRLDMSWTEDPDTLPYSPISCSLSSISDMLNRVSNMLACSVLTLTTLVVNDSLTAHGMPTYRPRKEMPLPLCFATLWWVFIQVFYTYWDHKHLASEWKTELQTSVHQNASKSNDDRDLDGDNPHCTVPAMVRTPSILLGIWHVECKNKVLMIIVLEMHGTITIIMYCFKFLSMPPWSL